MAIAFDPKADYSKRTELLKICTDRGISHEKLSQIVEPMRNLSHEEKELHFPEILQDGLDTLGEFRSEHQNFYISQIKTIFDLI